MYNEDIIMKIKNNPKKYLGEHEFSLEKMKIFELGYDFALYQIDTEEYQKRLEKNSNKWHKFNCYVQNKYKISISFSSESIIRLFSENEEEAFYKFFEEYEKFQQLSEDELAKLDYYCELE